MKKIYFALSCIVLGLLIQPIIWSCTCEDFIRNYTYGSARIEIYDAFDLNEAGTELVPTEWKKVDTLIHGDRIRVGVFFEYEYEDQYLAYQPAFVNTCNADCQPIEMNHKDSIVNLDVVSVYDMGGISAGGSVLAESGWNRDRKDSLLTELNTPFFPNFVNMWFEIDAKPTDGIFQLKALISKRKRNSFEVLSTKAVWE